MSLANWHEEKQSAWLYRVVQQAEPDAGKSAMFAELANVAETQARIWEERIVRAGGSMPEFRPSLRARVVAHLVRRWGPRSIHLVLAAMKVRGISVYRGSPLPGHPMPATLADLGKRHRGIGSGGNLRAAVFGVNDGLVSNASLIMGVAGATHDPKMILLSGVAGLLAGAFSMGAGEYVSVRSQRELYEYQMSLEREELAEYPEEEQAELTLIYKGRGLAEEQAQTFAREIMKDKERALDALAREELGLNPEDLGSPWGAATSSFLAFAAGSMIPITPFLVMRDEGGMVTVAVILSGIGLFGIGALLTLFTGRNAWWSGLRMTLIGGAAGAATYLIGSMLGVSLG